MLRFTLLLVLGPMLRFTLLLVLGPMLRFTLLLFLGPMLRFRFAAGFGAMLRFRLLLVWCWGFDLDLLLVLGVGEVVADFHFGEHAGAARRTKGKGEENMRDVTGKKAALHLFLATAALTCVTGCKVQVDKSGDGDSKNVKIATPFGSIAVNKDQSSAGDVGLPVYPGSVADAGDDGNKSAKVDMGFGSFKLRVRVAHFTTSDSRDQVVAFYRKALSEYGGVIECADGHPVGSPAKTAEGLSCDHNSQDSHTFPTGDMRADLQLKAGSERHQHIVSLKRADATTEFSLIAVDLPHGIDSEERGTN